MHHFRLFAARHDQLPAFHATYLVLAILIGAMLPLGAFGLLIVAHMTLDFVKYREVHAFSWNKTIIAMVRESLIDITLLLSGLTFAVYLHHSLPAIAGLSGLYRSELTILRGLATFMPKLRILHETISILNHLRQYLTTVPPHLKRKLQPIEHLCFLALGVVVVLLALAPGVLGLDSAHYMMILKSELIPWNI